MSRFCLILKIAASVVIFSGAASGSTSGFDSSHQIFHFHGEDTSAYIGIFIKHLGDINDDGFDDVALSSQSPQGTYIFLGGNPPDSIPDYFFEYHGHIIDYLDYSGDGISDLIISFNDNIYLFLGHGNYLDSIPYDSIVCPPGLQYYWVEASSFVNGDSVGDILVYADDPYNGDMKFLYINPFMGDKIPDWNYSITGFTHNIRDGGFIDFNGDCVLDIFIPMRPRWDSLGYVYLFLGPDYATSPDIIIAPPAGLDTLPEYFAIEVSNIGDINGDSWDDLGVKYWSHSLIYLGGPSCDTIYDYLLDGSCQKMSAAGDVNGDVTMIWCLEVLTHLAVESFCILAARTLTDNGMIRLTDWIYLRYFWTRSEKELLLPGISMVTAMMTFYSHVVTSPMVIRVMFLFSREEMT